jgi:predicted regulator of Ras-like GTPase activity (Roadblock/LC7/MglB family)
MQLSLKHPEEIVSYLAALTSDRQTGEVLLQSSEQSAKVYLNDGLILWAFATGQIESFQSILIKENQLTKEALLDGIKSARDRGKKNLDDILLALGIASSKDRNRIIERHTRSALQAIRNWDSCQAQFNATQRSESEPAFALDLNFLLGLEHSNHRSSPTPTRRQEAPVPQYGEDSRPKSDAQTIEDVLERFRLEVPGFIAAMVIDSDTGMPISSINDAHGLDLEITSAFYRNVCKSTLDALMAMGKTAAEGTILEEILVTSCDEFALVRSINSGQQFLYLSMDKDANPAMARVVVKRYSENIKKLLS